MVPQVQACQLWLGRVDDSDCNSIFSYGESVTYMNDEANLEEASKEVLIKLNEWKYSEDNLKNIKRLAYYIWMMKQI